MLTAAYGHTPLYSDSRFEEVDPLRTELCVGPGYPSIDPYSALGPLQSMAATGNMGIDLSPAPEGTKLEATYAVVGYLPQGMNTWAAPVDAVLTEQFTRLKTYLEVGAAALKPPLSK